MVLYRAVAAALVVVVVGVPDRELYTVSPSFSEVSDDAAARGPRRR